MKGSQKKGLASFWRKAESGLEEHRRAVARALSFDLDEEVAEEFEGDPEAFVAWFVEVASDLVCHAFLDGNGLAEKVDRVRSQELV